MSSDTDKLQLFESDCNFNFNPYLSPNSQYLKNFSSFSSIPSIDKPESALFTMIKHLIENRNQINIINSVLSMNSEDLDIENKLNHYKSLFTYIPYSRKYNKQQTKILLDLFHMEEKHKLNNNLELQSNY